MKVTKIYDLTKEIEDTSNDKVIIEMSQNEYSKLKNLLSCSMLYTDMIFLAEDIKTVLKQLENFNVKWIE